jgi:hypothetical protein
MREKSQTIVGKSGAGLRDILLKDGLGTVKKIYTGVGSREAPTAMLSFITQLAEQGWILRSGGAPGSDSAFETGCHDAHGLKEIYLPWKGFNGYSSPRFLNVPYSGAADQNVDAATRRAIEFAVWFHPLRKQLLAPNQKMRSTLKPMARNSQQVLGEDVAEESKSALLICWTPRGEPKGGTRQAIVLAQYFNVPVFNLGNPQVLEEVQGVIEGV